MITEQKKCWKLLAQKFDQFQTSCNNSQHHATTCNRVCKGRQQVTPNNVGTMLANNVASVCTNLHGFFYICYFNKVGQFLRQQSLYSRTFWCRVTPSRRTLYSSAFAFSTLVLQINNLLVIEWENYFNHTGQNISEYPTLGLL